MKTTLTVILVILALLFLQRECSRPPAVDPLPDTLRITKTVYNDTTIIKEIPKPYPVEVIQIREVEIPAVVDSLAIFLAYMSKNIYDRILMDDSTALIRIIDTVHQNQLWGSKLEYKNRMPVIIHETVIIHPPADPRFQLYVGGFVTGNQDYFGAGAAVFAKTKRDHLYGLGYDAMNKTGQIHMQWKISLKH
ncbi:MAG: hypothetical protein IH597_14890 [Bacteroidales bacterium]|nr:hypothetical protein [Bacteroidales bacterium]